MIRRPPVPKYDLLIKGVRVIDPSRKLDAALDVAIANGRIAAVKPNISADATETIDARGKLVAAGLIDIHTHAGAPGARRGGTVPGRWRDRLDRRRLARRGSHRRNGRRSQSSASKSLSRVLINIGRAGILPEEGDNGLEGAPTWPAAKEAIAAHRDMIAGVKARLSRDVAGPNDYEVLKRAQEVASSFKLPVMIHMGQTITPLPKLLALLKRGDVVTHMFAPPPNSIIDDAGKILPEVTDARRRGSVVRFGKWPDRAPALGHCRKSSQGRLPAGHLFHRLDSRRPHESGRRLPSNA